MAEEQTRAGRKLASSRQTRHPSPSVPLLGGISLVLLALLVIHVQATIPMCQHHRAFLEQQQQQLQAQQAQSRPQSNNLANQYQQAQDLIVCPKASQYNNLPQFPSSHVSPTLERQQREILKTLNASFTNHLQLSYPSEVPLARPDAPLSELIDDQLLNEIVSPILLDSAYERAKELIVKRRKLENELVRQGRCRDNLARIFNSDH